MEYCVYKRYVKNDKLEYKWWRKGLESKQMEFIIISIFMVAFALPMITNGIRYEDYKSE